MPIKYSYFFFNEILCCIDWWQCLYNVENLLALKWIYYCSILNWWTISKLKWNLVYTCNWIVLTIEINKSPVAATTSVLSNDKIAIKFIILIFSQNFTGSRLWENGGGGVWSWYIYSNPSRMFLAVSHSYTVHISVQPIYPSQSGS